MYIPELTRDKDPRFDDVKRKWAAIHEVFTLSKEVLDTERRLIADKIKKERDEKIAQLKWEYTISTVALPVDNYSPLKDKDVEKATFYVVTKSAETDIPESDDNFGFKKARKSKPFRIVNSIFVYGEGSGWLIPGMYNGKELPGYSYKLSRGEVPDIFKFDKPNTFSY